MTVYHHGHQHEWIVEGKKRDALEYEGDQRRDLRKRAVSASRRVPTFSALSTDDYTPHAERHLGAKTWKLTRRYQLASLIAVLGEVRLDEMGPQHVEAHKSTRLAARYRGKPIRASTINSELQLLGTILRWAREEKGFAVPEFKIRYLPTSGSPRATAWTADEVRRLLAAARTVHPPLAPLLQFLVNTGCRKGEGIAAEWSWIDWEGGMLRIPVTEYWKPKNKKPREVPIPPSLLTMLRALPRHARTIFPNVLKVPYEVFPNFLCREAIKAAHLRGSAHTTRHTFASHFLQARPDLFLLGKLLGHSTARVTELYAHMLPGHLDAARGAVDLTPISLAIDSGRRSGGA